MSYRAAAISSALAYGSVSMSITLFNKVVLNTYKFSYPLTMLLLQNFLSFALIGGASLLGFVKLPKLNGKQIQQILPLSLCFSASAFLGLASLEGLHIPMYNVLKRLTTLPTMAFERVFLSISPTPTTLWAVLMIISGALLAGIGDIHFDLPAYLLALLSCFATASYFVSVSVVGKKTHLSSSSLLFYNSLLSSPLLIAIIFYSGEWERVSAFHHWEDRGFLISLGASLLFGSGLTFTQFLCTQCNSPLTTTVVGQLKVVISTILSYFIFGGHLNPETVVGTVLNTSGGFLYVYSKWKTQKGEKKHHDK